MTTTLAYIPSPPQGVWHLGPVPIRAYALFIIAGIIVALIIGDRRWVARGGEPGVIYDIALWAVPFGLIGGRLYHVMTDWRTYFGQGGAGFVAALKIWDGGLGIWGAVALGGVGAWIACRRRGIPLPAFGDAIAPGIVLAQAIGRLGNYFNQELYGRPTTMPWGLEIFYRRDPSGVIDVHSLDGVSTGQVAAVVHPTFLYELIWNVLVFAALIYIDRRFKIGHGRLFAMYVAGYCVGRFWVELMRSDPATHIAGIRINSFTSTFVFIAAVVYIMVAPKGREAPEALRGKPEQPEEEESVATKVAKELTAVGAASGVVAAATVVADENKAGADEAEGGGGDKPPESGEKPEVGEEPAEGEAVEEPVDAAEPGEPGAEAAAGVEEAAEGGAVEEPVEAAEPEAAAGEEAAGAEEPGAEAAVAGEAVEQPVEAVEPVEPGAEAAAGVEEAAEGEAVEEPVQAVEPEAAAGE
ncbi:MAG: prolipoprotein diacylglyceryl transferase, partial [Mycolicibacterium sp.]|nr:prolipoprotein diacylglyceryl transferase [Mycolicibacterium sp.]